MRTALAQLARPATIAAFGFAASGTLLVVGRPTTAHATPVPVHALDQTVTTTVTRTSTTTATTTSTTTVTTTSTTTAAFAPSAPAE